KPWTHRVTHDLRKQSKLSDRLETPMGAGCSRSRTEERLTSRWSVWVRPAGGIRCARCECSNGGKLARAWTRTEPPSPAPIRASILAVRAVDDVFRAVGDFEVRRNGEQRGVGLRADQIGQLECLLAHPRIAAFAGDDGLEVGRSPDLGNDDDRPVV